jgi:hypothetical protein
MEKNVIYVVLFSLLLQFSFLNQDIVKVFGFYQNVFGVLQSNDLMEKSKQFILSLTEKVNIYSTEFHQAISDWQEGKFNNKTLIQKTNDYIITLEDIVMKLENFSSTKEYIPIFQSYLKSINSEIDSHKHFVKYLETGNTTENEISVDLFSKAGEYEAQTIGEFTRLNSEVVN